MPAALPATRREPPVEAVCDSRIEIEADSRWSAACALAADQRESASISIRESQTASTGGSLRVAGNAAGIPFDTGSVLRGCRDLATHFLCIESYGVGTLFTTRSFGASRRCG